MIRTIFLAFSIAAADRDEAEPINDRMTVKPRDPIDPADRWQWRVNRSNPSGEWFDSLSPSQTYRGHSQTVVETPCDGFFTSSYDLLSGLDVADISPETIDDFQQLFPRHPL